MKLITSNYSNITSNYSGRCVFFQTIAICWIFGAKKMYNCIELMVGFRINYYWFVCWIAIAPLFMFSIFLFYFIKYTPITYGSDYSYPKWGEMLGFGISLSSMVWVPGIINFLIKYIIISLKVFIILIFITYRLLYLLFIDHWRILSGTFQERYYTNHSTQTRYDYQNLFKIPNV